MSNEKQETATDSNPDTNEKQKLQQKQNPFLGCGAGILAMSAGIILWIFIAQKYQMPWLAVAIAFGIASAIRYAGKSVDLWYGIVGATLSLFTALVGNLTTTIFILSKRGKTPMEILSQLDAGTAFSLLKALCGPLGIIFYLAAIFVGFWFAFKHPPKNTLNL